MCFKYEILTQHRFIIRTVHPKEVKKKTIYKHIVKSGHTIDFFRNMDKISES